jgi:mRNA deadenylase 3'-5' endonuclease subunit Ccr4
VVKSLLKNIDWNDSYSVLDSMFRLYREGYVTSGRSNAPDHVAKDVNSTSKYYGTYHFIDKNNSGRPPFTTVWVSFTDLPWTMNDRSQKIERVVVDGTTYNSLR